jgi:hypothetical protein
MFGAPGDDRDGNVRVKERSKISKIGKALRRFYDVPTSPADVHASAALYKYRTDSLACISSHVEGRKVLHHVIWVQT